MKYSQWHDGSVKPVHEGVYQRKYGAGLENEAIIYCKYNGRWHVYSKTIYGAAMEDYASPNQDSPWRGVIK